MKNGNKPQHKMVGVYDRPARADSRWRRWLPWAIAVALTLAWLLYLFAR